MEETELCIGMSTILFIITNIILYYCWTIYKKLHYWEEKGVPSIKPTLKMNEFRVLFLKENRSVYYKKLYDLGASHKYIGLHQPFHPVLLIRDPETIKQILVNKFENFTSRPGFFFKESNRLSHALPSSHGKMWKFLRNNLTPAFTTGKISQMLNIMEKNAVILNEYIKKEMIEKESVDAGIFISYSQFDTAVACTIGLETNTLQDPDSEILLMAKIMNGRNRFWRVTNNLRSLLPMKIRRLTNPVLLDTEALKFFKDRMLYAIRYREENKVSNPDFLAHFIKLNAAETDDDLIRWSSEASLMHIMIFLFSAYVGSTLVITFALYELAMNPNIQKKVKEEIKKYVKKEELNLNYEDIREMSYLRMVISETLRKYPPAGVISRKCTKSCIINTDEALEIKEDTSVFISIIGVHYDPKNYPQPDVFDPERFSEEGKKFRHPYSFLSFGYGPRKCIAEKYMLMCTEVSLIKLLSKFDVSVLPEHIIGPEVDIFGITLGAVAERIKLQFNESP